MLDVLITGGEVHDGAGSPAVQADVGIAGDRVAVMYLGRIVEVGTPGQILLRPRHPYTQALISVLPGGQGTALGGEPPDPTAIPPGCRFHPRCPRLAALPAGDTRADLCRAAPVEVLPARASGSLAACHLVASAEHHHSPQGAR